MEVQRGYRAVMRLATSRPNDQDRPGAIVNNARREQAAAGF
jgi:hypothetical protein